MKQSGKQLPALHITAGKQALAGREGLWPRAMAHTRTPPCRVGALHPAARAIMVLLHWGPCREQGGFHILAVCWLVSPSLTQCGFCLLPLQQPGPCRGMLEPFTVVPDLLQLSLCTAGL